MLHINSTQLSHLSQLQRTKYEDRLFHHGRKHFAERCASMSDERLLQAIRATIERAREHGVTSELGVCLYFNVAVWFGLDFVRDPKIAWAFPISRRDEEPEDPVWILRVSEIASLTLKQHTRDNTP